MKQNTQTAVKSLPKVPALDGRVNDTKLDLGYLQGFFKP